MCIYLIIIIFFEGGGGSPSPFQAPVVQNLDIAIYRINH